MADAGERSQAADQPDAHGQVASKTPGRIRLRLNRRHRTRGTMERAEARLRERQGIREVETNQRTGSIMVRYDPGEVAESDVLAMLVDVGIVVRDVLSSGGGELPPFGQSTGSQAITSALADLDSRIARLTGRRVDLKLLFPASLGALGIRQVFVRGLGLGQIPAYVLLWYAFDSFYKLNLTPTAAPEEAVAIAARSEPGTAGMVEGGS